MKPKLMSLIREEKKPLTEDLHITTESDGVYVGIDDYDDVVYMRGANMPIDDVANLISGISKSRWFIDFTLRLAKKGVHTVVVHLQQNSILFKPIMR